MIGLFGGTFDPVHIGHLRSAIELRERLGLEQVRLIPCHQPVHRDQPLADSAHRLAMLRAAVAGEPGLVVDDCELQRQAPSYTVHTLATMRQRFGQQPLLWVLGEDAFAGLETWYQWQQLPALAHLVVLRRPGSQAPLPPAVQALSDRLGTTDPAPLGQQPAGLIWHCQLPQWPVAATALRQALAAGRSIRYLVPEPVWHYIQEQALYQQ